MKKLILFALSFALILPLVGCSPQQPTKKTTTPAADKPATDKVVDEKPAPPPADKTPE